jgi:hypothetical protein
MDPLTVLFEDLLESAHMKFAHGVVLRPGSTPIEDKPLKLFRSYSASYLNNKRDSIP